MSLSFMVSLCSKIAASTASSHGAVHVKIASKERMSFLAMNTVLDQKVHPPHCVDVSCRNLNMAWVYALFVFAKMIALKVFRYWAEKEFVRKTMSVFFVTMGDPVASVSFPVASGDPDPTAIFYDHFAFESWWQHVQSNHAPSYHDVCKKARTP